MAMDSRRIRRTHGHGGGHIPGHGQNLTVPGRLTKAHGHTLRDHKGNDSKSESSDHDRGKYFHEHVRLENTFQLNPCEDYKFSSKQMERAMKEILDKQLTETDYNGKICPTVAANLSSLIKERAKEFPWKRYRYVVQVVVGENSDQAVQIGSRCIWDEKNDNFACVTFKNKTVFAVAACYGIYLE